MVSRTLLRPDLAALALLLLTAAARPATAQTVGLLTHDARAEPGYTVVSPLFFTETYLVDVEGRLVHRWEHETRPGSWVYLLDDGTLLRGAATINPAIRFGGLGGRMQQVDWDGNVLWEFVYSDSLHALHHDIAPMPNGNVLMIAWEYHSKAEAIAAGRDSTSLDDAFWPEQVIEVRPIPPDSGEIVWQWSAWDHLIQDHDSTRDNFGPVAEHPERIDINYARSRSSDWLHANAIDYNPDLDHIALSIPGFDEIWIIDHSTTTEEAAGHTGGRYGRGGDLLYRWGNPAAYRAGDEQDRQLFFQHDVEWIDPGLPGAGHLLVFDNGITRPGVPYSTVLELAPPLTDDGRYRTTPDGRPEEATVAWRYDAPGGFFSAFAAGQQRLPGGNTLIAEAQSGLIFEVTPEGEVVWEYVNPVTSTGPVARNDSVPIGPTPNPGIRDNSIFRADRYAPDHPGLQGKDLSPKGVLELPPVAVEDAGTLPGALALGPNAPNPFARSTTLTFALPRSGPVRLTVFDLLGRKVATLADGHHAAGTHTVRLDASGWPSGVYLCRLDFGGAVQTRLLTLVR